MTDKEKLKAQFKVGDTIRNKHWHTAVHKITSMDDKSYHLDNGGKVDISSQQLWELVKEPVNEEWIEELRTKLDSMSKEEFEQVWGKYRVEEEEPVSDELEKAAGNYAFTMSGEDEVSKYYAFLAGAKWQKAHNWKPAEGTDLPIFDREVIVLTQPYPLENSEYAVSFAHRPNPNGLDGKSVTTGKVEHYTPKIYDKGGWNIPNVKWWLDCSMPKEIKQK